MDNPDEVVAQLESANETYDGARVQEVCDGFVRGLCSSDLPCPERPAQKILGLLRKHRYFSQMDRVAEMLILTGQASSRVQRQYAQALIEQGKLTAAVSVLQDLVRSSDDVPGEQIEATGLLGRVHKERFLRARKGSAAAARHLEASIGWYYRAYAANTELNHWPAINTVAMLARGERDGLRVRGYLPHKEIARRILNQIEHDWQSSAADMWSMASAGEACVALDDAAGALDWYSRYVREPYADVFELGSTRRQLIEIWQLREGGPLGAMLLPLLASRELSQPGSNLTVRREAFSEGSSVGFDTSKAHLEKVFGRGATHEMEWVLKGCARTRSVARLGLSATRGEGTGFLVRGSDLKESLGPGFVLLTNAHVLSQDDRVDAALRPADAIVTFQTNEDLPPGREFRVEKILWSSPPGQLDTTIATLTEHIDVPTPIEISPYLPRMQPEPDRKKERVYILGHPDGGTLAWSIQDNVLLDYSDPKLHYRAPTTGGSSGSPVFDGQWRLIGIHHAGSDKMNRLQDEGAYEANEGIMIRSIKAELGAN